MEAIRNSYNRLNVLTDDELVPALEDNKKARIDCLTKVFGLNRNLLMSSLESSDVTQVCSTTGETLIIEKVSLLGDLTDVCDNLEKSIHSAVKADLNRALKNRKHENLKMMIESHLGSTCLVMLGLLNTEKTDKSHMEEVLKQLVDMALTETDNNCVNHKVNQLKIKALTTLAVYYNDLNKRNSCSNECFTPVNYQLLDESVFVVRGNDKLEYGFEFNDFTRLVVTPLTTKAYNYNFNAKNSKLAGSFFGPAGTGKTETVKDFAHKLGRNCCVVNCSDQMTCNTIEQLLNGVNESNYIVFDEFNRILPEVLGEIAEVFTKHAGKNIFITMNPGYAGRTQLSDELHSKFYNCEENENDKSSKSGMAMLVPDYSLICEVQLYCQGIITASSLAKVFVSALEYFRENASKQCHYDYGMRTALQFARCFGFMKRKNKETCEKQLFMNAWDCTIACKLTSEDAVLSEKYFEEIFPSVKAKKEIPEYFKSEPHAEKLAMFEKLLGVRHSAAIVSKDKNNGLVKRFIEIKKAQVETVELGDDAWIWPADNFDISGFEVDGSAVAAYRKLQKSENEMALLLFADCRKGSPAVMEPLNTVMDDNKVLILESSQERLYLNDNMRLVFEFESCECLSPASVSRMGIIYI